jgi:hypothetical protein
MPNLLKPFFRLIPLLFLLFACKKNAVELDNSNPGFSIEKEPNAVLRSLQMSGIYFDQDLIVSDTSKGRNWYIENVVDTTTAYEGIPSTLRFTLKGKTAPFTFQNYIVSLPTANGFWQVNPILFATPPGFSLQIPSLVQPGLLKLQISAKLVKIEAGVRVDSFYTKSIEHVVNYSVPDACELSLAGKNKQGLTFRKVNLGNVPGKLKISFLSMDSSNGNLKSDRFDLRYNSAFVLSSASTTVLATYSPSCAGINTGAQKVQGWKEYTYDYDPKQGKEAELYIQSNCTDTTSGLSWQLKMECPK